MERASRISLLLVFSAATLLAGIFGLMPSYVQPSVSGQPTYIGSKACAPCHEEAYRKWAGSLHNRMLQKAAPEVIEGDFNNRTLEHEGWRFKMFREDGTYCIQEWSPSGRETLYNIDYTLGSKRIQHFISVRPGGAMRVSWPTWDILKKEWIHSSEIIRNIEHTPTGEHLYEPLQIWNHFCWNCHTSQEEENFDIQTETYKTAFTETGINCEMCHGPGSMHVEKCDKSRLARWWSRIMGGEQKPEELAIASAGRFRGADRMVDCLQCHSRRIMVKKGFEVGKNFNDFYQVKLIELVLPASTANQKTWNESHRRFGNEALNLWESKCFYKGNATCINCHDPHQVTISRDSRYRQTDNLCTQCHKNYKDEKAVAAHTHHKAGGKGSQCIECHMLLITTKTIKLLQHAEIRDHNISSIPIPENTIKYNIPNSCNNACHEDKSPQWVIEWMDKWYPRRPRFDRHLDNIAQARQRDPKAVPQLLADAADTQAPLWVRARATAFLGEFPSPESARVLTKLLDDPDSLIRAEAARSLSDVRSRETVDSLNAKLSDTVRIVRLNAFFALLKMGALPLDGSRPVVVDQVKEEYLTFLNSFPTVYEIRVDLGTFLAVQKNYLQALQEYKNAYRLRPEAPLALYYMGVTYAQLGKFEEALAGFRETLDRDPNFRNTRQLMAQVQELMKKQ